MLTKAVLLAAITVLAWGTSDAQYNPRPVKGVVTDKRGNTLPGAVVQLENTQSLDVRSYITRKDGAYQFNGLNDDVDYTVRAHYKKYWSETRTLSKFNSSKEPVVNLVIPID